MSEVTAVQEIVSAHFLELWPAVEAGLATCATLLLSDNVNPVALIPMLEERNVRSGFFEHKDFLPFVAYCRITHRSPLPSRTTAECEWGSCLH